MKMITKKLIFVTYTSIALLLSINAFSQVNYLLDNDCATGQLVVYIVPDVNYAATTDWNPAQFTIEVTSGSTTTLGAITGSNGFNWSAQNFGSSGGSYFQVYNHAASNQKALTAGVPFEVARISLVGNVGEFVTFNIPAYDNAWIVANNGNSIMTANPPGANQIPANYVITTATNVPLFAGIFWDGVSWCGGSKPNGEPGPTNGTLNCYINGAGAAITYFDGQVNQLNINAGGDLIIAPGFALTALGATHIEDANSLIISADATGTGSFIDNGTITYGASGSATVQSYLTNSAGVGNLHIHQVGPMVQDPTFVLPGQPTQKGLYLQDFDLTSGSTYAYQYLEPTNTWQNIWQLTEPIPAPHGIIMSDINNTNKTLSQVGQLSTGALSTVPNAAALPWSPTYTAGQGQGCLLLSNPYPSGLDLDNFFLGQPTALLNSPTFYIWEHTLGNYSTWNQQTQAGTGSMFGSGGLISPGQGFFAVLSNFYPIFGNPPLNFANSMRFHYHAPFLKTEHTNFCRLIAEGNLSTDDMIIYFMEGASNGIDTLDSYKWQTMYEGATQISSPVEGEELTQNILSPLGIIPITVPVNFSCGAEGQYKVTASELETFESGTEIWLEDLQTGGQWHNLVQNPVYTFTASPDDPQNRFVLHFFGPTGIGDPGAEISPVQIYSYDHDAYIVNRGNEVIEEYVVYDMMGRELQRGSLPSTTVNKVFIGQVSGYYIVKVVTNSRIYSEKVFINR